MNLPHPSGHQSLETQIQEAQAAIRLRHRVVGERMAHVAVRLKKRITSPLALIAAFGGGFLIDRILRLIPRRQRKPAPATDARSKPGLIARIMEFVVLGRTLLTTWPAALLRRVISLGSAWSRIRPRPEARSEYLSDRTIYP